MVIGDPVWKTNNTNNKPTESSIPLDVGEGGGLVLGGGLHVFDVGLDSQQVNRWKNMKLVFW